MRWDRESNHSKQEGVHFLQIWIVPERRGLPPWYEQKHFTAADKGGRLLLVASHDGVGGSVTVHQDVRPRHSRAALRAAAS